MSLLEVVAEVWIGPYVKLRVEQEGLAQVDKYVRYLLGSVPEKGK